MLFRSQQEENNKQLIPPIALGRHRISPTHEHVVSIYFASSETDHIVPEKATDQWKWVSEDELEKMGLKQDTLFYAKEALKQLKS